MGDLLPARGFGASTTGLDRLPAARTPPHGPSGLNLGGPYGASRLDAFSGAYLRRDRGTGLIHTHRRAEVNTGTTGAGSLGPLRVNGGPRVYSVRRRWGRPGARRTSGGGRSACDPRGQVRGRASARRTDAMFERFTDRARRVVVLAQEEARMLNHNYIGTEHILLGLIHEGEGVAAKALESMNISLEAVRAAGRGDHRPGAGRADRTHPVHAASQEGPGAVAARGAAARSQLHRHRAHPARPDPRG